MASDCPRTLGPGDWIPVGGTQPLPRLRPSAHLAGPGRAPYGCLQSLGGRWAGVVRPASVAAVHPRTLAQASVRPGGLSGSEVGALHGVEPVDGVPHTGLQGAHVRGA